MQNIKVHTRDVSSINHLASEVANLLYHRYMVGGDVNDPRMLFVRDIQHFFKISCIYGDFEKIYPAITFFYRFLPPTTIIREAMSGNPAQLKEWIDNNYVEDDDDPHALPEFEWEDNIHLVRITVPSKRCKIELNGYFDCSTLLIYFDEGSIEAAQDILQFIALRDSDARVKFVNYITGYEFRVSNIHLDSTDIEEDRYVDMRQLHPVARSHAPEWIRVAYDMLAHRTLEERG